MATGDQPCLEELSWEDIRDEVGKVNPQLKEIIDGIGPSGRDFFYRARYPFGSKILDKSKFHIPYNREILPIDDPRIPNKIKEQLGYSTYTSHSVPLALSLNNSVELHLQAEDRITPFSLYTTGKLFGLWSALPSMQSFGPRVWNITAGARCIFLLPKIQDSPSYKKLCKARNIKLSMPRTLLDQGIMLAQIAKHEDFQKKEKWTTNILFFTRNWIIKSKDEKWKNLLLHLYEQAWQGADFWRNKVVYDLIWDTFVKDLSTRQVKVNPYIINIVEHIIMVGLGVLPGFSSAINNQSGPIDSFKADFINIYGLKNFAPTIMIPKHLSGHDKAFVYVSLQLPTHMESIPKSKKSGSITDNLKEIKTLLENFRKAVLDGKIPSVIGTPFYIFFEKVEFAFFHSDPDSEREIRPSYEMPIEDEDLISCPAKYGKKNFSDISPFIRGCVRIRL